MQAVPSLVAQHARGIVIDVLLSLTGSFSLGAP